MAIGEKAESNPSLLLMWNLVSPYFSRKGKRTARGADGDVGMGSWRKRMLVSNRSDKDCVKTKSSYAKAGKLPRGLSLQESL